MHCDVAEFRSVGSSRREEAVEEVVEYGNLIGSLYDRRAEADAPDLPITQPNRSGCAERIDELGGRYGYPGSSQTLGEEQDSALNV